MAEVKKSDATKPCNHCGGVMKIQKIEPIFTEPTMMQHSFACESCGVSEAFKFEKNIPAQ